MSFCTFIAEKELVEFLSEEINAEKKAQKLKTIPTDIDGFKVSLNGAEVKLTKRNIDETYGNTLIFKASIFYKTNFFHFHFRIIITFNINHTVEGDEDPEVDPTDDKVDMGEMKSKPSFTVEIQRGNQNLEFTCSYNNQPGASGADDSYSTDLLLKKILYLPKC